MPQHDKKLLRVGWSPSGEIFDWDAPVRKSFLFWDQVLDYLNKGYKVIDTGTGKPMTKEQVQDHIDRRY